MKISACCLYQDDKKNMKIMMEAKKQKKKRREALFLRNGRYSNKKMLKGGPDGFCHPV
jgi:hypothetical protein